MENKKESLIEENSNQTGERSDSFIRRTTFIQTPESENDQDIKLLKEMGFDEGMVKKVYLVLRPRNLSEAIEMMSEQNGMYQHDFIESRASSNMEQCYICKKERRFHRDYDRNRDSYLNILNKNKEIALVDKEQVALEEGEKGLCAICLEDTNEGNRLQCGHFFTIVTILLYKNNEMVGDKQTIARRINRPRQPLDSFISISATL